MSGRRAGQPYIVTSAAQAARLFPDMVQIVAAIAELLHCGSAVVVWVQPSRGKAGGIRYAIDVPKNAGDVEIAAQKDRPCPTCGAKAAAFAATKSAPMVSACAGDPAHLWETATGKAVVVE